ncbi:MAG: fluoride efflux transporter CrcB [Pseudomonadota bacterium]
MWINVLLVGMGGALGASGRYLSGVAAMRLFGPGFPWGTVFVNLVGSLAMGLLIGWLANRTQPAPQLQVFVATGVLGGFTTFSAFSLDAVTLWERGETLAAFGYVLGTVVVGIAALFAGLSIMRAIG